MLRIVCALLLLKLINLLKDIVKGQKSRTLSKNEKVIQNI